MTARMFLVGALTPLPVALLVFSLVPMHPATLKLLARHGLVLVRGGST